MRNRLPGDFSILRNDLLNYMDSPYHATEVDDYSV
jgi:hypothetical protein